MPADFKHTEKQLTCHGIIKATAIRVDPGAKVAVKVVAGAAEAAAAPGARAAAAVRHPPISIRPYARDEMRYAVSCRAAQDQANHLSCC